MPIFDSLFLLGRWDHGLIAASTEEKCEVCEEVESDHHEKEGQHGLTTSLVVNAISGKDLIAAADTSFSVILEVTAAESNT